METTNHFSQLSESDQKTVITVHSNALKCDCNNLMRIFKIGNPKIVQGKNDNKKYCRVHSDSVGVVNLLIKNYL